MQTEPAAGFLRRLAARGGPFLLASFGLHALAIGWVSATAPERLSVRAPPEPQPIEFTVRQSAHRSLPPPPIGGPGVLPLTPAKPRNKRVPPAPRPVPERVWAREPRLPSAVAAAAPTPTFFAAPDAGGAEAESPGAIDGQALAVRGALPGAPQPSTGPSFDAAYLHNPPPRYPALARRLKLQGTAILRVLVGAEGRPERVAIERSCGVELLDQAALEAVRQWSFVPARQGDRAIAAEVNVPLRFRLNGAGDLD